MYCKYCGKPLLDNASVCSNCGRPIFDSASDKRKKNIVGGILAVVAGLLVAACIYVATSGILPAGPAPTLPNTNGGSNSNAGANSETTTDSSFGEGVYKVGSDIEAGEYFVYCTKGQSCYYAVYSDSTGTFSSIVANNNIETFSFISVEDGQYLEVNRGRFVKASDANIPGPDSDGVYGPGMYRAGIDIPVGEFKVTSDAGSSCYLQVSKDSKGTLYSIVSNDNIDTFTYITVSEGQYLTVERGTFFFVANEG